MDQRTLIQEQLNTRAALIEAVRKLRDDINSVIDEVGPERMEQPGSFGIWTFKDLIAHLTSWRQLTVERLEAGLEDRTPNLPWPENLEEGHDVDEINRLFYESHRNKPVAEVLRDSEATFDDAERLLSEIPEADLFTVGRYAWLPGYALGPGVISGTCAHFYVDHEPDIRAWLNTQ